MARTTSPICKKCRREGTKLFLKGERCFSAKCAYARRSYAPGANGQRRGRWTEYGQQLREKQKAKAIYGVMERQFRNYYEKASTGLEKTSMFSLIERRFDNIVYRMGFAASRREARQAVLHGKFFLNGKKSNIPSIELKPGDKIELRDKESVKEMSKKIKNNQKMSGLVSWLKLNPDTLIGEVTSTPKKEDIGDQINERLIIEYYSR